MKDLDYYLRPNFATAGKASHLSLVQRHISGGRISRAELDAIQQVPHATEISVSGLLQDTFEYFIQNYGRQFKVIHFWKCPLVADLSPLETLVDVEYVLYFWNQRAVTLWDFSKTPSLKGLAFDDFTRMHDLSDLERGPLLQELHFGDKVWDQLVLNSLSPLRSCRSLKRLTFSAKKILDASIEPISRLGSLERLEFPPRLFTTEQVAWLRARLPHTISSTVLTGYGKRDHPVHINGKDKDTVIVGRRKPLLDSTRDAKALDRYITQFNAMVAWFQFHPAASPEDYPGSG